MLDITFVLFTHIFPPENRRQHTHHPVMSFNTKWRLHLSIPINHTYNTAEAWSKNTLLHWSCQMDYECVVHEPYSEDGKGGWIMTWVNSQSSTVALSSRQPGNVTVLLWLLMMLLKNTGTHVGVLGEAGSVSRSRIRCWALDHHNHKPRLLLLTQAWSPY